MKARWPALAGIILVILGFIVPILAIWNEYQQEAESFGDILWLIVSPGLYWHVSIWFWIPAAVLFFAALVLWLRGR